MWYPDMATCIFNHFILDSDVCAMAGENQIVWREMLTVGPGLCSQRGALSDWTCEECTSLSSTLADYMMKDEVVVEGVTYLQGECFCGQEGHTEDCPGLVQAVLPLAFPVLSDFIRESTVEHCQEIVGVC